MPLTIEKKMKNWTYRFHFVVVERTDEQVIVTLQPTMDAVFILPTTWERGNKGRQLKSGSPVDGRTDGFTFTFSSLFVIVGAIISCWHLYGFIASSSRNAVVIIGIVSEWKVCERWRSFEELRWWRRASFFGFVNAIFKCERDKKKQ